MVRRQLSTLVRRRVLLLGVILSLWFLGTWNLACAFPPWWDEGWTMTVARTWVERGHYGLLQFGEPAPPGLNAAFPATAWIALGFRLFGVGIWQARFVSFTFMLLALLLLYRLTYHLNNSTIAIWTLFIAVFMSVAETSPLHMGRQVLAEPFMFVYLLIGYLGFHDYLRGKTWGMLVAVLFWGIALKTKAQVLPFWLCSILLPLAWALVNKHFKVAAVLGFAGIAAWLNAELLTDLWNWALTDNTLPSTGVDGLFSVTALVLRASARIQALVSGGVSMLPLIASLIYEAIRFFMVLYGCAEPKHKVYVRIAMLGLVASWLGWYLALSAGWGRYLWPSIFFGAPFVAHFLYKVSGNSRLASMISSAARMFKPPYFNLGSIRSFAVICFLVVFVMHTVLWSYDMYSDYLGNGCPLGCAAMDVAEYLNTHTAEHALIETYDSELFVLLDRPYHFPPDQLHVDLLEARQDKSEGVSQHGYDPLVFSPDYIVVRYLNSLWNVYPNVIEKGHYELEYVNSVYKVYRAPWLN